MKNILSVENLNRFQKKYLIGLIIIVAISLVISFLLRSFLSLDWAFVFMFSALALFLMFACMDMIMRGDKEDRNLYIKIIFSVVTILVLMVQSYILLEQAKLDATQIGISKQQAEILDRTSQSNKADLFLSSSQGYVKYNLEDFNEKGRMISIGITNLGKAVAPYARVLFSPNSSFVGRGEEGPNVNEHGFFIVQNLTSLEYETSRFVIFKNWMNENLTIGVKEITFRIDCPFCTDPLKEQKIPICIYSEYYLIEEECGGEWK
ncbi:hypothetical protein KAT80_01985 [Candidatus Pacearchaeota archaeon]|nr:hypothetical protein [Candidatus Pacearchaeota archaeon]